MEQNRGVSKPEAAPKTAWKDSPDVAVVAPVPVAPAPEATVPVALAPEVSKPVREEVVSSSI